MDTEDSLDVPESPERLKKSVGRRIRKRRRELSLTLEELAEKLGTSMQYVNKCETGKQNLTLESLAKFANALEATVVSLLEDKPAKT